MPPNRPRGAARLGALLLATIAAIALIALIGVAAYALDRHRIEGRAAAVAMAGLGAFICIAVFYAGSIARSARERRAAQQSVRDDAEAQARRAEALARRRAELEADPDPARRRYVAMIDRGELIDDAEIARREARIAELGKDPANERYIERVFQGERISDRAIAYWSDPSMLVLCEHLQPVEAALRALDPGMTPHLGRAVETRFAIDWPLLRERYALPDFVELERAHPRSEDSDGVHCTRCSATLLAGYGREGMFPQRPASSAD